MARIPKDIPLDAIAPVLCAGITVYKGLKESGARPGQTVAIVGAGGGLGSLACQYATAMGLRIIAIDGGDEKREMTAKLGAESYIDFSTSQDVVKDVQAATPDGTGPHAVLLVAVSEKPFQQAAEYVRPRGTVVLIGLPANAYIKARKQIYPFSPAFPFTFFLPPLNTSMTSPHSRLPNRGQHANHQGQLCRQPQGHERSHRIFPPRSHQRPLQASRAERAAEGLRPHAGGQGCRSIRGRYQQMNRQGRGHVFGFLISPVAMVSRNPFWPTNSLDYL